MAATGTRLTIVHVLSSLRVGGQERMALDLAAGQQARGHRAFVVSLAPQPHGPLAPEFEVQGISVLSVPKKGRGYDVTLPVRLALACRRHGATVVHAHNAQPLVYAAPAGRLAGAIVVATRHGGTRGSARQRWLWRAAAALTDAYVAVSPEVAEVTRALRLVPERKLSVIENGIDLQRFTPDATVRAAVRRELGLPDSAFVVGMVGRMVDYKDPETLVRAARPLARRGLHVVLVGDGPERERLQSAAADWPADEAAAVHWVGLRSDVPRLLQGFDLFALTSRMEGHPLVLLEAMAAGLPVAATAVGGVPSIVREGVTGWLVPAGDAAGLQARFEVALADREVVRSAGARAREQALARYARETMVNAYLALYEAHGAGRGSLRPTT